VSYVTLSSHHILFTVLAYQNTLQEMPPFEADLWKLTDYASGGPIGLTILVLLFLNLPLVRSCHHTRIQFSCHSICSCHALLRSGWTQGARYQRSRFLYLLSGPSRSQGRISVTLGAFQTGLNFLKKSRPYLQP
jgi:hypothetical protein